MHEGGELDERPKSSGRRKLTRLTLTGAVALGCSTRSEIDVSCSLDEPSRGPRQLSVAIMELE